MVRILNIYIIYKFEINSLIYNNNITQLGITFRDIKKPISTK